MRLSAEVVVMFVMLVRVVEAMPLPLSITIAVFSEDSLENLRSG